MRTGGVSTFAALRHSEFRLLWAGVAASNVAQQMVVFALGWLVIEMALAAGTPERAPLYVGLLGLANAGPGLVFGLFGGVLADRFDRRSLLLVTQSVGAAVAASLVLVAAGGASALPAVLALVVVASTAVSIDATTQLAALPRLVPGRELMSAIGLTNMTVNVAQVAGPLIGGILIGRTGTAGLFALPAVLFALAFLVVLRVRPLRPAVDAPSGDVLAALREGAAFVARDRVLLWLLWLAALIALFGRSVAYLLPAVAHDVLAVGAVELSWLLAARGFGTLAGSLLTASLGALRQRGTALALIALGFGLVVAAFSMQRTLAPAIALCAAMGTAQFLFSGFAQAVLQSETPDRLRGRVLSFYLTTVTGVTPLGVMVLGSLGAVAGIGVAIGAGATVLTLAAIDALLRAGPLRAHRAAAAG